MLASTQTAAPLRRASSSAPGDTSTATPRAPLAAAIITADRPTPPQPCTATHSPAATRPCAITARNAVANRQPSAAAAASSSSSGSRTRFTSACRTATSSANEPQPVKPGWVCRSQTCWSPARHDGHRPHAQTNGAVTRSPGRQPRTSAPAATTTPANSCPGTCGRRMSGSWPCQPCQSLRHNPVAPTRTTTPSAAGTGSSTRQTSGRTPNRSNTTARMPPILTPLPRAPSRPLPAPAILHLRAGRCPECPI